MKYYIEITKKEKNPNNIHKTRTLKYSDTEDAKAVFGVLVDNFEKYHALRIWKYEKVKE